MMSGPKTSHYTLTAEQRRILRAQQEHVRKIKSTKAHLQRSVSELSLLCVQIERPIDMARELNTRTGDGSEYIEAVNLAVQRARDMLDKSIGVSGVSELNILETRQKVIDDCLKNIKRKSILFSEEAVRIEQQLKGDLNECIDKGFSLSFEQAAKTTASPKKGEYLTGITARLRALLADPLPVALADEVNFAIQKATTIETSEFLENFNAVVATPLVKRCRQYVTEYEQNIEHFDELVTNYQVLCGELGAMFAPPTFSMEALKGLEEKVEQMGYEAAEQAEQAYITHSIDAVMVEMGYTILGSKDVVKRSGKRFRSELYSFDEGTAVNVTYSSDGKITMELGGISDADRLPSENETAKLCDDMTEFCGDFTEIEKKLERRGIVVKGRVNILPPDAQYAQIINVSDYDTRDEVELFAVKRSKTQKSQTAKKEI